MNIGKFKMIKKIKNKKRKGFTLVELLAVIVILAVIMVITIPTVIGSMNNAKEKAEDVFVASIERSLNKFIENELQYKDYMFNEGENQLYVSGNMDDFGFIKVKKSETEDLTISDLINMGYLTEDSITNPKDDSICNKDEIVNVYKDPYEDKYYYKVKFDCANKIFNTLPQPEAPDLNDEMVPVLYNFSIKQWEVADIEKQWYDYYNFEWANAVFVKDKNKYKTPGVSIEENDIIAMFVWIPRFSYTIGCTDINGVNNVETHVTTNIDNPTECLGFRTENSSDLTLMTPGAIDIKFINVSEKDEYNDDVGIYIYSDDERNPTNWYTHPAFTYNNNEIDGFWFGKFETSVNPTSDCYLYGLENNDSSVANLKCKNPQLKNDLNPRILPNYYSVRYQSLYSQKNLIDKFSSGFIDSHISRKKEWSAVSYLSQSVYGKYGNKLYEYDNKYIYSSSSFITGIGQNNKSYDTIDDRGNGLGAAGAGASTTGTIYGIYDMAGGSYELVMGNYNGESGAFINSSNMPTADKFDVVTVLEPNNVRQIDTIGYGFSEVVYWRSNSSDKLDNREPWIAQTGVFSWQNVSGSASTYSFRTTIIRNQ